MQTLTNGQNLYVHIPSTLKTKVDSLFNKQSSKTLEKIYFILYQINKEGKKTINQRFYNKLLAIGNGLTTAFILQTLKLNEVITLTSDYIEGKKSKEFKLTTPYNIKYDKQRDYQLYYTNPTTNPIWVNKFLSKCSPKELTEDKEIIAALRKQVEDLKATITLLQSESMVLAIPITKSSESIQVKTLLNDVEDADETFFTNPVNFIHGSEIEQLNEVKSPINDHVDWNVSSSSSSSNFGSMANGKLESYIQEAPVSKVKIDIYGELDTSSKLETNRKFELHGEEIVIVNWGEAVNWIGSEYKLTNYIKEYTLSKVTDYELVDDYNPIFNDPFTCYFKIIEKVNKIVNQN